MQALWVNDIKFCFKICRERKPQKVLLEFVVELAGGLFDGLLVLLPPEQSSPLPPEPVQSQRYWLS